MSNTYKPVSEYWRFASELSIIEATLLILNIEPQGRTNDIEGTINRPIGYDAIRSALLSAIRTGELGARTACYEDGRVTEMLTIETWTDTETCDVHKSFVRVDSLKEWLLDKGHNHGYFFPRRDEKAPYLNPEHERYAPKLAAAVSAWMEFDPERRKGATPKQSMQTWLRLNAPRFGLTSEDGSPSEGIIEELARIANWATKGGAPKVIKEPPEKAVGMEAGGISDLDFSRDFDDEIPF